MEPSDRWTSDLARQPRLETTSPLQPDVDGMRDTSMLTRRNMLRSVGLAGTAVAVPTLLSGCGDDALPRRRATYGPGDPASDIALVDVSRSTGGQAAQPQAAAAVRGFSADLYRQLALTPGNLVCSPYSVSVALAMTWNGARGQTASEMQTVLHAPGIERFNEGLDSLTRLVEGRAGEVRRSDRTRATIALDVANSLWGQRGVRWQRPFLVSLARYYGTGMRLVDYVTASEAARARINGWTADQTHDRIPEIIAPGLLDAMTRLVLVNAIYLKAPWEETFTRSLTRRQQFTRSDGSQVQVDMMSGRLHVAGYGAGPGWRTVRLPYAGGALAMTIVVPDGPLAELEKMLDPVMLTSMVRASRPVEILNLHLPRWEFRLEAMLNETLSTMGMPTAFNSAQADFSGMTTMENLYIGAVVHQAFISVDEHGTEAAAATAVIMEATSGGGPPPVEIIVDRPFLFVIHDVETSTPLFVGRVSDPSLTT